MNAPFKDSPSSDGASSPPRPRAPLDAPVKPHSLGSEDAALETLNSLVARARAGDEAVRPAVSTALDEVPTLVATLGNLAYPLQERLLRAASGGNILLEEASRRWLATTRRALEGSAPTPLEKLLAERIVLNRLFLAALEGQPAAEGASLGSIEAHEKRLDRAQRRYLAAVKALAQVRRLNVPAVQVNIAALGGQQVNIAGGEEKHAR